MATDVSSLLRMINGGDFTEAAKSTAPITRDFLGGSSAVDAKELDLDLQVPCGWEKRLDLKSGKIYFQRIDSNPIQKSPYVFEDLNFPAKQKQPPSLLEESSLDLKLESSASKSSSFSTSTSVYQSVCTLEKVKSALERAEKSRKRSVSSPSSSSSSVKDSNVDREERSPPPAAAACPGCLFYVMVSPVNPTCPRCSCRVPIAAAKRPRIDLNLSV